jgi:hypothetical protein
MATVLGGGAGNQIIMTVRNNEAAGGTTITRGSPVALDITAIAAHTMDGLNNDLDVNVDPVVPDDDAVGAAGICLGIAMEDILPQEYGRVCQLGPVRALFDDTAAVGAVIGVDASANTRVSDAANATFQAPVGICLETGVQGELKWIWCDCISTSFGGCTPAGDGNPENLWGVAY